MVVTCGSEGAVLVGESGRWQAGVYPVSFVDGSGCGDAFTAGYIYGLLQGLDARDCLRWGSALGASCVRAIGTTQGVFTSDETEAFLNQHELPLHEL